MKKTAVIVDDEARAISALKHEIKLFVPEIVVIGQAQTIVNAKAIIEDLKPDIVFLDIRLSEGLGFAVIEDLSFNSFHLIFTTAYSSYAIDAIREGAFDYLLKPINGSDINASLQRMSKRKPVLDQENSRLEIAELDGKQYIYLRDIIRAQALGNYSRIWVKGKKPKILCSTLKELESKGAHFFIRCHHSHLVNRLHVTKYSFKESTILLTNNTTVPVSARKKSTVNKMLSI